jgi:endonuclease/exonuclease/phosphatase (EEP) superfamily protein YafD
VQNPTQPESTAKKTLLVWLVRIARWLNWLSFSLLFILTSNRVLGRFYFFELFTHFQIQLGYAIRTTMAVGFVWLVCTIVVRGLRPMLRDALTIYPTLLLLMIVGNLLWPSVSWHAGDYDFPLPPKSVYIDGMRVLHANVLHTRTEYGTTIAMIRQHQPDICVLQEIKREDIRLVTSQLRAEYPYWFACWSKQMCWLLVASRAPVRVDEPLARQQQIVSLTTAVRGKPMALVTVHPRTPLLPAWFNSRNEQLATAARLTRHNPLPTVLIGDFNISVFSPIYKDLFGTVEKDQPFDVRYALESGRTRMTQPTWPAWCPPMMIPIDHAFVNAGFRPLYFRTLDQPGSDHRAIVADLNFIGSKKR